MREILFRGKRKDNGEWVEGYITEHTLIPRDMETYIGWVIEGKPKKLYDYDKYEVIPETVGQYTGLKDKNGKRIFEGDIVRLIEGCPSCHDTEIVKFKDGGFAPFSIAGWECTPKWEECEVIGTMHDNPELLEEKHDR